MSYQPKLATRRTRKGISKKRKINRELIHIARVAKLFHTICCCGPIYMKPDRSRFRLLERYLFREVLISDLSNPAGKRHISMSGLRPLIGYDLEPDRPLSTHLDVFYTIHVQDHSQVVIALSSFIPAAQVESTSDATHCRIIAVAAALDFHHYSAYLQTVQSPIIPLNRDPVPAFALTMPLPQPVKAPIIIILGLSVINGGTAAPGIPVYCQSVKIIHIENPDPTPQNQRR